MFVDRWEAGKQLGRLLIEKGLSGFVLYAIPSGGIPVAIGAARETGTRFELVLVKKLAYPWSPETAFGAIALDGSEVISPSILAGHELLEEEINVVRATAMKRLQEQSERLLGKRRPLIQPEKLALVVDDGIATGYTALAAVKYLRNNGCDRVGIATPVTPEDTVEALSPEVDGFYAVGIVRTPFFSVGAHYADFKQYEESELIKMLAEAQQEGLYPLVEGDEDRDG